MCIRVIYKSINYNNILNVFVYILLYVMYNMFKMYGCDLNFCIVKNIHVRTCVVFAPRPSINTVYFNRPQFFFEPFEWLYFTVRYYYVYNDYFIYFTLHKILKTSAHIILHILRVLWLLINLASVLCITLIFS